MPFVRIEITGLNELLRGVSNLRQRVPETNRKILEESTTLFERVAKEKVHVITGRTKNSIRKGNVTPKFGTVEASWGAKWEEKREGSKGGQGPHKFLTEAARVTVSEMPDIIKKHYDDLIRQNT